MINVLIVEDDEIQLQGLSAILSTYNPNWNITTAKTYDEALTYIKLETFQLFLLDVELDKKVPSKNGIDLGRYIRQLHKYAYTPILFITCIPEKIQEALNETHCYHYLLKPYNQKQLYSVLDSVCASPLMEEPCLYIKDKNGIQVKIKKQDIFYITSEKRMLIFYTSNGIFHGAGSTLKDISNSIGKNFLRCHKKYLVNLNYVKYYDRTLRLISIRNTVLPVGRAYKETFEEQFHYQKYTKTTTTNKKDK